MDSSGFLYYKIVLLFSVPLRCHKEQGAHHPGLHPLQILPHCPQHHLTDLRPGCGWDWWLSIWIPWIPSVWWWTCSWCHSLPLLNLPLHHTVQCPQAGKLIWFSLEPSVYWLLINNWKHPSGFSFIKTENSVEAAVLASKPEAIVISWTAITIKQSRIYIKLPLVVSPYLYIST